MVVVSLLVVAGERVEEAAGGGMVSSPPLLSPPTFLSGLSCNVSIRIACYNFAVTACIEQSRDAK